MLEQLLEKEAHLRHEHAVAQRHLADKYGTIAYGNLLSQEELEELKRPLEELVIVSKQILALKKEQELSTEEGYNRELLSRTFVLTQITDKKKKYYVLDNNDDPTDFDELYRQLAACKGPNAPANYVTVAMRNLFDMCAKSYAEGADICRVKLPNGVKLNFIKDGTFPKQTILSLPGYSFHSTRS